MFQLDVKNVFLNGYIEKDICMFFPPGYKKNKKCCKLKKTLYRLKQSRNVMKKHNYSQKNNVHMLFVKENDKKVTIFLVYVDDTIVIGDGK